MQLPGTFRALRHYNYRLWFVGQTVSLIGTWMQSMAQQVLVYRLTGTAESLGIVNSIALLAMLPLFFVSGSFSDRYPKRRIILIAQTVMLFQALGLAVLTWTNTIQVWHVYAMAFVLGAAQAFDMPARQAFTVDMVEGKEDLTNAIGLNSAMFNLARALGPALSGIIVAATGEGNAFFINSLTFLTVIICLLLMRNLPQSSTPLAKDTKTIEHVKEGLHYIRANRILVILISLVAVNSFLSSPYSTLMPVFSKMLSPTAMPFVNWVCDPVNGLIHCQAPEALPLGILLTMVGIGATLAALTIAATTDKGRRGMMMTIGNLGFPAFIILFALSRNFLLSAGLLFFVGVSFVLQNVLANTLIQLSAPDNLRGRVMSVYMMTMNTTIRLGGLQAGFMADWLGAPLSVGLGAVIALVYCVYIAIRYPAIRKLP